MPSESNRRNNRIEVDLKVLKGKEIDLLSSFSAEFARSVKSLSTTLGDYATQLKAHGQNVAQQMGSGIGLSGLSGLSGASTGGYGSVTAGPHIMTPAEKAAATEQTVAEQFGASEGARPSGGRRRGEGYGSDQDKIDANREKIGRIFSGSAGAPDGPPPMGSRLFGSLQNGSYATAGLNMVERSQFSMGSFGEPSLVQGLSMASKVIGDVGLRGRVDRATGEVIDDSPLAGSARAAGLASITLGAVARTKIGYDNTVAPLARTVSSFSASRRNSSAQELGYDTGADSGGGWQALPGLNWGTEGGRRAVAMKWTDRMARLSPGWGSEQQAAVGEALRGRGIDYGKKWKWDWDANGHETHGSRLAEQMQSINRSTHMDIGTISEFQSRRMRYDPTSLSSLPEDMEALSKSAKAAGMSVDEMGKAALSASASLIQNTGMSASDADQAITAGAVMGLQPEQTARFQNRDLALRALASDQQAGGDAQYSEILRDPSKTMAQTMKEVGAISGVDMKRMRKLRNEQYTDKSGKSSREYEAMRSQLDILYQDPSTREMIFQGMTPDQLLEQSDSKEIERGALSGELAKSIKSYDANDMGDGSPVSKGFGQLSRKDFKDQLKASGVKEGGKQWQEIFDEKGRKKEWEKAQDILSKKGADDTNNVTLGLTPQAAKLVKKLEGDDGEVSRRNLSKYTADSQPFISNRKMV